MNVSNALHAFTTDLITAATPDAPLYNVSLHADIYEAIQKGKTIRIDDIRQATPNLTGGGEVRMDNAVVNLHFLSMPATDSVANRIAARDETEAMLKAWVSAALTDSQLSDASGTERVCNIGEMSVFFDWIRPNTVKIPVAVLRLRVNPR